MILAKLFLSTNVSIFSSSCYRIDSLIQIFSPSLPSSASKHDKNLVPTTTVREDAIFSKGEWVH